MEEEKLEACQSLEELKTFLDSHKPYTDLFLSMYHKEVADKISNLNILESDISNLQLGTMVHLDLLLNFKNSFEKYIIIRKRLNYLHPFHFFTIMTRCDHKVMEYESKFINEHIRNINKVSSGTFLDSLKKKIDFDLIYDGAIRLLNEGIITLDQITNTVIKEPVIERLRLKRTKAPLKF